MPPRVVPPGARQIRIEDIDRGVKHWFDRVVDAHVRDENGKQQKVTVLFGTGERWVMAADRQGIRDRDGRLILPVIHISQKNLDNSKDSLALGINTPTMTFSRRVSPKTAHLASLDSLRPVGERRLTQGAVHDVWTIPYPASGDFNYQVRVQAGKRTQLNQILEKILSCYEFFNVDSFVVELDGSDRPQGIPQGQGSTELAPHDHQAFDDRLPLDRPYVVAYLEGSMDDAGNQDEFTDQERIIQQQFSFRIPAALQLDPEGKRPAVQVERTAFNVNMGDETTVIVDDPYELEIIFGPDGVSERDRRR
jgi:hypothetical protein